MRAAVETLAEGTAASLEALAGPLVQAQDRGSNIIAYAVCYRDVPELAIKPGVPSKQAWTLHSF